MNPSLVDGDFTRLVREHESHWEVINESVDILQKLARDDDVAHQLKRLKYFLAKVSDMNDFRHHWDEMKDLIHIQKPPPYPNRQPLKALPSPAQKTDCVVVYDDDREGEFKKFKQPKSQPVSEKSSQLIQRKRKLHDTPPRDEDEWDTLETDGTLEKPHLVAITEGANGKGIRFYTKINGDIKVSKVRTCRADLSFLSFCGTDGSGGTCSARHNFKILHKQLSKYNKKGRTWGLDLSHSKAYDLSSYLIVPHTSDPHTCGDIRLQKPKPSDSSQGCISSQEDNSSHEEVETPPVSKKRRSQIVPTAQRMAKVDTGVPFDGKGLLTGECSNCRAIFDDWHHLLDHIAEDSGCKDYYSIENKNYCFICDRPFLGLRTHFHDVLKGRVAYAVSSMEPHNDYAHLIFHKFKHCEWAPLLTTPRDIKTEENIEPAVEEVPTLFDEVLGEDASAEEMSYAF